MSEPRKRLREARRWIIKVGSSILTDDGQGLNQRLIDAWTADINTLLTNGCEVVLVSSGSITEGLVRLGWSDKPSAVNELQAAAAVGQMGLVQAYERGFQVFNRNTAQILLTYDDITHRRRYLNARATLQTLIAHGVVPVVNENDTVTTAEIKLGDNDTLAAQVTNLIDADVLVLLTDQNGLYDKDPRHHSDAVLLERADANDPSIQRLAGPSGTAFGSGGMETKVLAAKRAAQAGATTVVASGREPNIISRLAAGEPLGTMFTSDQAPVDARKRWLANHLRSNGELVLDDGACTALRDLGVSLLAVGVQTCRGTFSRGELVSCVSADGTEVARGLTNYNADEVRRLQGLPSDRFVDIMGYAMEPELIHRDNLVVSR